MCGHNTYLIFVFLERKQLGTIWGYIYEPFLPSHMSNLSILAAFHDDACRLSTFVYCSSSNPPMVQAMTILSSPNFWT